MSIGMGLTGRKGENMKKIILVLVAIVMLSGCMTFNEAMLRKVDIPKQQNPEVIVETKTGDFVQKFNGTPNRGVMSGTTVLNAVVKSMMNRWKKKGLIADFGAAGKLDKKPDFTLIVSGVRDEEGSVLGAVLCGITLYIIPTSNTLIYDLDVELVNNKTQQHYFVKVKNGVTTWMEIIFLPFFAIFWVGSHNMLADMADYSYDELKQQGAFNGGRQQKAPQTRPVEPIPSETTRPEKTITSAPTTFSLGTTKILIWDFSDVKSAPENNSSSIATVRKGDKLTIMEQSGEWVRVRLENDQERWIRSEGLE